MSLTSNTGADLEIRKTVDNPSPNQGDDVRWTIFVVNNGPETATDVIVYDTLPGGLSYTSDSASIGDYDEQTGQWRIGELASGATATLNIESTIESVGSIQTNSASVNSSTFDPDEDNNRDSADTQVVSADVRIEKTVSNHTPEVGEQVTWTITVINDGPNTASVVKVTDMLPPGVVHQLDSATIGDYDETSGEWFIGDLWSGGRATLTIDTLVTDASTVQNNTATVSSANHDPNLDNNTADASLSASGSAADLQVEKTVSDSQPAVGDQVTWTVILSNEGPDGATDVVLLDNLPAGVTLVDSSITGGKFDPETGQWCFDFLGSGETHTLTLVTTVDEAATQTNHASADSDTFDPDSSDNADSATIHAGRTDLSVEKVVDNPAPAVGETVSWTITVRNDGPDDATGVNVRDELPAGLRLESEDATSGFYDQGAGQWWIGDLPAGQTETLTLTTTVEDASRAISNTSTVVSRTLDTDESNNSSTATTDAESADLELVKHVSDESPNVGDEITWTIVVSNNGPDTAVNTVVFDNLPNGVQHVADTATIGDYDEQTGSWVLGDLASGDSHTLEITTVVTDSDLQMNIAMALSDTFDPNDCNNHDFATTDADEAADLSVQKSVNQSSPNLGDDVTWTIVVANNGPDSADNVVLTDTLPAGVTLVGHDAEVGSFDADTGEWSIGTLASGESVTLTATTTVNEADVQVNTGSVSSDTFDFNTDNNSADAQVDAVLADLAVVKTVDNETPDLGEAVTWTIVASNTGPDDASGTQVQDVLPAGVSLLSASPGVGSFNAATGLWDIGTLASGDSVTLTLVTSVDDPATAQINTSTISADTFDPDASNNNDSASVDAIATDLAVQKSVDNPSPNAGENVAWTIVASNNGPDDASGVEVLDILPAGVTLISSTPTSGAFDAASGIWDIGALASGESTTLTLVTSVDDPASAQVNTSTISADTFDPDASNNSDDETVDAVAADLQVEKTVDNETPNAGESVTWTIVASNNGPDGASAVEVTDVLPAGVTLETALANTGEFDAATGLWQIGDLDSGDSATLIIITSVDDPATAQVNTSSISSDTFDPIDGNNNDQATVDAIAADLAVVKTVDNATPNAGESVAWTIVASNNGPDPASGVTVQDVLPDGVTLLDAMAQSGSFDAASGVWTIGDLASGDSVVLALVTSVDDPSSAQINTSTIGADTFDPNSSNNTDEASVDAIAADLAVEKSVDNPTPAIGESVVWTIVASNNGPDAATGVEVLDALPDGVTLLTSIPSAGNFDASSGIWSIDELASGASASLTILTTVDDAAGAQVNVSSISSDTFDPNDSNNSDDASVDAIAIDLELAKSVDNDAPSVGDSVTWSIAVTNNGPDDASGVSVSDTLPAGVTLLADSATSGSFNPATGEWSLGDLASGASATLELTTSVDVAGTLVNNAEVTSADQVDSDSTAGNGDAGEDDQDSATIDATVAGPMATDNDYSIPISGQQTLNAFMVIDRSSSMAAEITLADGSTRTRLEITRDAIIDFAAREQVTAVKVVAFDRDTVAVGTDADNPDEVSGWFDVTSAAGTAALETFIGNLSLGAGTNYEAAINASMDFFATDAQGNPDPLPVADATNYYFLSDGAPSRGGNAENLLTEIQEDDWQAFVDSNFDTSIAVGFGGGISRFDALEQVAHEPGSAGDDPDVDGDDPLVLVIDEADDLPSGLLELITESISGNVLSDDTGNGLDGPASAGIQLSSMQIDGETFSYDGNTVSFSAIPLTGIVDGSTVNIPTVAGGRLEFNFANGDFSYLSPNTTTMESFEYTITDADGNTDSASVSLDVFDPAIMAANSAAANTVTAVASEQQPVEIADLLSADNDELEWQAAADASSARSADATPALAANDVGYFESPIDCDCDFPLLYL